MHLEINIYGRGEGVVIRVTKLLINSNTNHQNLEKMLLLILKHY